MDRSGCDGVDGRDRPATTPRHEPNGETSGRTGPDARWLAGFAIARATAMDRATDDAIDDLVAVVLGIAASNGTEPVKELRHAADLVAEVEYVDEPTRSRTLHLMGRARKYL